MTFCISARLTSHSLWFCFQFLFRARAERAKLRPWPAHEKFAFNLCEFKVCGFVFKIFSGELWQF